MSDVKLDDLWYAGDRPDRIEVETVASMDLEPGRSRGQCGRSEPLDLPRHSRSVAIQRLLAIGACMHLDHLSTDSRRGLDLPLIGLNEERDPDARMLQLVDERRQVLLAARDVEPAFGRPFFATFGNQTAGTGDVT